MSENLSIHDVSEIALGLMHQVLNDDLVIAEENEKNLCESLVSYLRGVDELTRRLMAVMTQEDRMSSDQLYANAVQAYKET